ncbi:enoyl-CoA hydratase/isomerase family protein [Acidiferrimicrobium sp. IK]|uniref:enoyl-CoA hydratase/isomerase family protein n=1 Tax=Acidiferrimicrobium sp. IK TaxID=2871700 RepID=UPI0021CB094E|nr:enoyl-CoA hydratase/isomerase family protein [Acidiferrimicrobium sp. IK]MCU4186647.1 enoyl-CoA hydratase/isomerase family protein [Acidiferrimicrobium sp. IK]
MTAYEYLLEEERPGGIRILTLNRPDNLNSWNAGMRAEMRRAFDDAAAEPALRCLIVVGAGRAFSAGEDVTGMADLTAIGTRGFRAAARGIHSVFDTVESMEVPVIAAINGVAAGGGFELALSCDFRVMSTRGRFVMPEAKVGLIPGSGGCSRLVRHVGLGRAKELVMLGGALDANRALELGLATSVCPEGDAVEEAVKLAERIGGLAPLAVGMAKLILNTCTDVDAETGRRLERLGQSVLKLTNDHQEGAAAFVEKRPPQWTAT